MQKTERFSLVLTETEKGLVERLAEVEGGLSQAALLRRLIHKAAREHDVHPTSNAMGIDANERNP